MMRPAGEVLVEIADPARKVAEILSEIGAKAYECNVRRRNNQHDAEQHKIHQVDHDQREKCSMITQVGLVFRDHPTSEREMERPRRANDRVKEAAIWLHVVKNAEHAVERDREDAVEGKKVRRERDPEIGAICQNVAAVTCDAEPSDAPTHEPNPNRVCQFVTKNVKHDRARQTRERD